MADFPALPLFTDAYLGDTTHLSLEEHGAYLKLLMIAWRSHDCALADDDQRLAIMLGVPLKRWRDVLRPAIAPFWIIAEGQWTQKKLSKVRAHVIKVSEKRKAAAAARYASKPLITPETAPANAASNGDADALLSKTKTKTKEEREDSPPPPSGGLPPSGGECDPIEPSTKRSAKRESDPDGFAEFYAAYPRHVGRAAAVKAYRTARRRTPAVEISAGLDRARSAWAIAGTEPEFIPHPATWLRQGRWADEDLPAARSSCRSPMASYARVMTRINSSPPPNETHAQQQRRLMLAEAMRGPADTETIQ